MEIKTLSATPNAEEVVCKAARNDYMSEWVGDTSFEECMESVEGESLEEKKRNLLEHLIRSGHYGPLENVHASFAIKGVSRVVMAQATRHRHLSFDVQSQRYVDFSDPSYTTPPSLEDDEHFARGEGNVEVEDREEQGKSYHRVTDRTVREYEEMMDAGVPAEDARYVLPNSMHVNMVMSGNLRALLHVVNMRSKGDVQKETRELANGISDEISEWVPTIYDIVDEKMPLKLGL